MKPSKRKGRGKLRLERKHQVQDLRTIFLWNLTWRFRLHWQIIHNSYFFVYSGTMSLIYNFSWQGKKEYIHNMFLSPDFRDWMIYMGRWLGCVAPACFSGCGLGWYILVMSITYPILPSVVGLQSFLMPSFLIASVSNLATKSVASSVGIRQIFSMLLYSYQRKKPSIWVGASFRQARRDRVVRCIMREPVRRGGDDSLLSRLFITLLDSELLVFKLVWMTFATWRSGTKHDLIGKSFSTSSLRFKLDDVETVGFPRGIELVLVVIDFCGKRRQKCLYYYTNNQ